MKDYSHKIITIPNILSLFRLLLIPAIVFLFFEEKNVAAGIAVLVSGLTDIIDGFIARKFNMKSRVGQILDPVADKLTQIAVMVCLCFRFTVMIVPLCFLAVKELAGGIISLKKLRITGKTADSKWHGKAATVCLYLTCFIHILWAEIPYSVSYALVALCVFLMSVSFVMYLLFNFSEIKNLKKNGETATADDTDTEAEGDTAL